MMSARAQDSTTTIDILSDSVVDICDKLFYQATNGKTIDLAWEAPQPASVNPLSESEAMEWGDSAMKISVARVTQRPMRVGSRVVSANTRFAQRSSAQPFYGYKSDPVLAPSFQKVEPIGPIAKAIKAAGELAALAHRNGEDEEPVWDLIRCGFGVDVSKYKRILKPDFGSSSRADEIKLIRSPNHMLYGFNSNAPTVGTDSGKYRSETMDITLLFDWHSMHLTMRFLGECMVRYSKEPKSVNTVVYFAPAYQEGRYNVKANYAGNIVVPKSTMVPECLRASIQSTMRYLEGSSDFLDAHLGLRSATRALQVDSTTPLNIEHIRELASRVNTTSFQLPKDVSRYHTNRTVGEVHDKVDKTFFKTVVSGALKTNMQTVPGWRRILVMLIGTFFSNSTKTAAKLTHIMRKKRSLADMSLTETESLCSSIASSFPAGTGFLFYVLLDRLSPSSSHATTEFCLMIAAISGLPITALNTTYDEAFTNAVLHSQDPSQILSVIQTAYNSHSSSCHGVSQILRDIDSSADVANAYDVAIRNYVEGRQQYWASFYSSVVSQCQENLILLKEIASDRGLKKLNQRYEGTQHIVLLDQCGFHNLTDDELIAEIAKNKTKSVLSSFSSLAYKYATVTIDNVFRVKVELKAGALHGIILRQANEYARKRQSWGKKLRTAGDDWPSKVDEFKKLSRKTDMCNFVDDHFQPNVKWMHMLIDIERKFEITQRSVQRMLQNNLSTPADEVKSVEVAEHEEVDNMNRQSKLTNKYAILLGSDSEDEDSVGVTSVHVDSVEPLPDSPIGRVKPDDVKEPLMISYSTRMGKSLGATVQHPTAPTNLVALFNTAKVSTKPKQVFDSRGFSLRDKLKFSHLNRYNDSAFLAFLKQKDVGETDFKGTQAEVAAMCEDYLEFYGNDPSKGTTTKSKFDTRTAEDFDIM